MHMLVLAVGVVMAAIACLAHVATFASYAAFVLSMAMVIAQTRVLARFDRQLAAGTVSDVPLHNQRMYFCLTLLFFGSMWVSWQVEVALSRYAIPYLPLWVLMLSIAVAFWRALSAQVRLHASG